MDKRARNFLEVLQDGRWHRKIWKAARPLFGVWTVEACVHLGLVSRKLVMGRIGSFKITANGKRALENPHLLYGLDRESFSEAIRCVRGRTFCCHCL